MENELCKMLAIMLWPQVADLYEPHCHVGFNYYFKLEVFCFTLKFQVNIFWKVMIE